MDAVVLAGGRSRRMGSDKATLLVDGNRLIDRALATLAPLGGEIVIAAGERIIADIGVRQVHDRLPGEGPLLGIEAGLGAVDSELVAVLAVDSERPSAELLRTLAEIWDGASLAVVPEVDGRLQPLHACWARAAHAAVTEAIARGERSPTDFLAERPVQVVRRDIWVRHDPDGSFARSFNRPDDLP